MENYKRRETESALRSVLQRRKSKKVSNDDDDDEKECELTNHHVNASPTGYPSVEW
jgi:hypothetical protein